MVSAIETTDSKTYANEHILAAVEVIGRSKPRRKVFEAVYYHKTRIKSVAEIVRVTGLKRMRVLQEGGRLRGAGIVDQYKIDGETSYGQKPFYQTNKGKILRLLGRPDEAAKVPSIRRQTVVVRKVSASKLARAQIYQITIDDIDSFAKVKRINSGAKSLPSSMSEDDFKHGVQAIIGETGTFKDWGGEQSDLYTTRLKLDGKRRAAAFGFKGPGVSGPLVPSRTGKNGDQIPRLFKEPGDVFFVQHWREIRTSIVDLMRVHAVDKSIGTRKPIWYGVIDGHDSNRLRLAYPSKFKKTRGLKSVKKQARAGKGAVRRTHHIWKFK